MKIELNNKELKIIQKSLSDLIEKYVGVSQSQETYINNIDNGMKIKQALQQFEFDNRKEWEYFIYVKKNKIYCLYDRLFKS